MKDRDQQVELSTELRNAMEEAPVEAEPSPELEERMVDALRERGLVVSDTRAPLRSFQWGQAMRIAASLVIFASGITLGYYLRSSSPAQVAEVESVWQMAARVQQTGSDHAEAMGQLAAMTAEASSEENELAIEIALAAVRAALQQAELIDPSSSTVTRLLEEVNSDEDGRWIPVRVSNGRHSISF